MWGLCVCLQSDNAEVCNGGTDVSRPCTRLKPGTAGGNTKRTADRSASAATLATFLDRYTTGSTAGRATRLDLPRQFILGLVSRKRIIGIRNFQLLRLATRIRTPVHFPQEAPAQRPSRACVRMDLRAGIFTVQAMASGPSRSPGFDARRPQTGAPVAPHQLAVVQVSLLHANAIPHLFSGSSRNLQRLSRATEPPD